jgi:hypothetical protein
MALAEELIAAAEDILLGLQGTADTQQGYKEQVMQLIALRPAGLTFLQRTAMDVQSFATVIQSCRAELRPFIMVYPAAFGLSGPWETVLALWAYTDIPQKGAELAPNVKALLESSFTGYTTLITT